MEWLKFYLGVTTLVETVSPAKIKIQPKLKGIFSHIRKGHAQEQEVSVKKTGKLQHISW